MKAFYRRLAARPIGSGDVRHGFTLVEMLVVVAIIALLVSLMFPALNAARESARRAACQNNLRQIGVGMQAHAARHGQFCSGACDWGRDGCVTERGWVADQVISGIPVGQMLCPSNPNRISEVLNDLMTLSGPNMCGGVTLDDMKGNGPRNLPDGSLEYNPCRYIIENPDSLDMSPGSETRRLLVEQRVLKEDFNTNYTASWILVRSEPVLTKAGNLANCPDGCESVDCLMSRSSTAGPLTLKKADGSERPASTIPFLGCGGAASALQFGFGGELNESLYTVRSVTRGPVLTQTVPGAGTALLPPGPFNESGSEPDNPSTPIDESAGTPREGELGVGWWAAWNATLQDYRRFAPVHRGSCNVLFADGGVRAFSDGNKDGLLNNGFPALPGSGFADDTIELPRENVYSGWTLKPQ